MIHLVIALIKMTASTALLLFAMHIMIMGTSLIEALSKRPPNCRAGSVEAYFTDCEVSQ